MEDSRIVDLYWQKNADAIKESDSKYGAYCFAIADNILHNKEDSEECVNDTWHAAWTRMPPECPRSLKAFLGRITRNLSISRFRANRAQKRYNGLELMLSELEECVPSGVSVEEAAEEKELGRHISSWLETLPEADRILFIRRYWYCDSVREIAKSFGFSESKVKMILLRTRNQLKEFLVKEGILDE